MPGFFFFAASIRSRAAHSRFAKAVARAHATKVECAEFRTMCLNPRRRRRIRGLPAARGCPRPHKAGIARWTAHRSPRRSDNEQRASYQGGTMSLTTPSWPRRLLAVSLAALALAVAGCSDDDDDSGSDGLAVAK